MEDDVLKDRLYIAWCELEYEANCIYDEVDEDFTDPRFIEASKKSRKALDIFLRAPTVSLPSIMLKLEIACECEDFYTNAVNPDCPDVAPVAVVGAIRDLENLQRAVS